MTTREQLTAEGFDFFMFTQPEQRAEFRASNAEHFEFAEFSEVFCTQGFEVLFLGVRRLFPTLKSTLRSNL